MQAGRAVDKLKQSRRLSPQELKQAQEELLSLSPTSIPPLIDCLGHGEARGPAIAILERLATGKNLAFFVEALASPSPAVVSAVTQVLETSTGYDPHALLPHLFDAKIPKSALDSIFTARQADLKLPALIDLLPDLSKEARAIVFRLLERTMDPVAKQRMVPLLNHEDWSMRMQVTRLLARSSEPTSNTAIRGLLNDQHPTARLEAVKAIQNLGERAAVPELVAMLRDPDLKVQTAAIDALVTFADAAAVPHLLEVLKDESEYVRRAAVEVLNEVATPAAILDLVRALRDQDWWVRVRAADALGSLGGDKVVDAIVGLLSDQDDFIRRYAVEILNSIASPRAVEPLIRALEDEDWWVRERSIDALGKTKDPRAVQPLWELAEREKSTGALCVQALAMIGDSTAVQALCALVSSDQPEAKRAAIEVVRGLSLVNRPAEERALLVAAIAQSGRVEGTGIPLKMESRRPPGPDGGRVSPSPDPFTTPTSRRMANDGPVIRPAARPGSGANPPSDISSVSPNPSDSSTPSPGPAAPELGVKGPSKPLNFYDLPSDTILLDRYRILRTIGKGGFGAVYLVHDAAIQEDITIKILNPQLSIDDLAIRRFVRELKLTRKITHKNVIRIYDLLDLGGARAVSMEYFPGRDLGKIIKRSGRMSVERALTIMAQVCEGLAAAHMAGVIHRDVKPANILVSDDDAVKIVDFGLASARQHIGSRLTKSGLLVGTPEYMAPEQINGSPVDPRADLYSVGILMYELLAGKKPFTGETAVQVLFQHLEGGAEPISSVRDDVPPELEALVARAMAKEVAERHPSAHDLRDEILAVLKGRERAA
jgi:serine/threonine-protein kinase